MKSRTVIILWSLAIVLGVIACIVQFGGDDESATRTRLAPGDKLLPGLPIRDIAEVTVSQGDDTTVLKRLDGGTWGVAERAGYPVNHEKLRNLLGALSELVVTQGYPADSGHFARFGLVEKSGKESERGLRVTMEKADGTVAADVFLGKFSGTSRVGGRFTRTVSDDSGVYAVGETFPGITAKPKDWLSTDFLRLDKIKTIALAAPGDPGFKPWQLKRHPNTDGSVNENGQFTLAGMAADETMQLTSTNPLRNLFSYAGFRDVLAKEQADETSNPDAKLRRVATVTTFDGLTYTLTFWPQKDKPKAPKADPRLPAVQSDYLLTVEVAGEAPKDDAGKTAFGVKLAAAKALEGHIYQVSQSTVSPLQKKRSDFVKSKNRPTAVTPPIRVPALPDPGEAPAQP